MIKKSLIFLSFLSLSFPLFAHCPSSFKDQDGTVCFMLEDNLIYIYSSKLEHSGPYKDLSDKSTIQFKTLQGTKLESNKIARGIYKIISKEKFKELNLEITLNNKTKTIHLKHEKQ